MTNNNSTILLIEDEPNHRELIGFSLENNDDLKIIIKDKLIGAFDRINKSDVDLIISDVSLPDGNAIEYFKKNNIFDDYYVVLMTSFGDEKKAVDALKSGALDYVVKDENTLLNFNRIIERAFREIVIIKEKEQAETALKESEDKYRQLVEKSNDIPFVINGRGMITYVGPQVQRYGFKLYELIGKSFFDVIYDKDSSRVFNNFNNTLVTLQPNNESFRIETPSKGIIWVEENTRFIFDHENELIIATGLLRDITDRVHMEIELKESEEKFRTLFDASYDVIFITKEDIIIECNSRSLEVFAVGSKNNIIGKSILELSADNQQDGYNSKDSYENYMKRAFIEKRVLFKWNFNRNDDTSFNAEVSLNKFILNNQDYLQAIVREL